MSKTKLKPASFFSDHMVLQRNMDIPVFGRCGEDSEIIVSFAGIDKKCSSDAKGFWQTNFPKMEAGGPWTMKIQSEGQTHIIEDILIGDVWFCTGQSNMGLPMERLKYKYADDYNNPENPNIRFFNIPEAYNFKKEQSDTNGGQWKIIDKDSIDSFSAAEFYFSRFLEKEINIPVGIIDSSIGGTPIESWMSEDCLAAFPDFLSEANRLSNQKTLNDFIQSETARCSAWMSKADSLDKGLNSSPAWYQEYEENEDSHIFDSSSQVHIPGNWNNETENKETGVFWFRREFELSAEAANNTARLWLGRIIDSDTVWVNGIKVGTTAYQYPPRIYDIEKGVLKEGSNSITVRVVTPGEGGEFCSGKPYCLETAEGKIHLEGPWLFKTGCILEALEPEIRIVTKPEGPFNAMSAPALQLSVKGIIWYQGESNLTTTSTYQTMLCVMLNDYKKRLKNPELPVLIIQLPNYGLDKDQTDEKGNIVSSWAEIRNAQRIAADNTGAELITTHDCGEWNDIHPLNKKDIGYRLASAALNSWYGKNTARCPHLLDCSRKENRIILNFENIERGFKTSDNRKAAGFQIAGTDGKYKPARVEFDRNSIQVWAEDVKTPCSVRYAWENNPDTANIVNSAGFPLPCFETQAK